MYVWTVWIEERWTNTPNGVWEPNDNEYNVVADNAPEAIEKVRILVVGRDYVDDDGKIQEVVDARVVGIKRGAELDA